MLALACGPVAAADNLGINIHVTIHTLTIEWSDAPGSPAPRTWLLNAVWNGVYDTNTDGISGVAMLSTMPNRFDIANRTGAPVDIYASVATDPAGWTLAPTNTAQNTCVLANQVDNGPWTMMTSFSAQVRSALANDAVMTYDLRIRTPSATSNSSVLSGPISVTLTAMISP